MNSTATFYPAPGGMPFSSAVRAGGFLMRSGQIPFGEDKRPKFVVRADMEME